MRRVSAIRRITAVLAIISVFAGTQGFVVSSHTCNSCGTHEEIISLFGSEAGKNHECQGDGESSSCCEAPAPQEAMADSCCSIDDSSCEIIGDVPCCQFESEIVNVETPAYERSAKTHIEIQPFFAELVSDVLPNPESSRLINILPKDKHGGGPEIIQMTCCLLL